MLEALEDSSMSEFGSDVEAAIKTISEQLRSKSQLYGALRGVDEMLNQLMNLVRGNREADHIKIVDSHIMSVAADEGQHPLIAVPTRVSGDAKLDPRGAGAGGSGRSSISSTGHWVDGQASPVYQPEPAVQSVQNSTQATSVKSPPAQLTENEQNRMSRTALFLQQPGQLSSPETVPLFELLHPADSSMSEAAHSWTDLDPASANKTARFMEDYAHDRSSAELHHQVSPRSPSWAIRGNRSSVVVPAPVALLAPNLQPNPLFDFS